MRAVVRLAGLLVLLSRLGGFVLWKRMDGWLDGCVMADVG